MSIGESASLTRERYPRTVGGSSFLYLSRESKKGCSFKGEAAFLYTLKKACPCPSTSRVKKSVSLIERRDVGPKGLSREASFLHIHWGKENGVPSFKRGRELLSLVKYLKRIIQGMKVRGGKEAPILLWMPCDRQGKTPQFRQITQKSRGSAKGRPPLTDTTKRPVRPRRREERPLFWQKKGTCILARRKETSLLMGRDRAAHLYRGFAFPRTLKTGTELLARTRP